MARIRSATPFDNCLPNEAHQIRSFPRSPRHADAPPSFPRPSAKEIIFQNAPKGGNSVAPADFLPFGVGSSVVRDRHLVYPDVQFADFGGDFRLEAETVLLDRNLLQHFSP